MSSDDKDRFVADDTRLSDGSKFVASESSALPFTAPDGQWKAMLSSACSFPLSIFEGVMLNLIKNPNVMSSHLFRADIYYDSDTDSSTLRADGAKTFQSTFAQHMKPELRPRLIEIPGYEWQRTFVRNLVPRNRQLDKDMIQTCHIFSRMDKESKSQTTLIIYLPHTDDPETMPWYHPSVQAVGFSYTSSDTDNSTIAIHIRPFESTPLSSLQPRLDRTCLNLLQTIHKHGRGQQAGYQKRVHHDQIIPQQAFQDTYARLKQKYAKSLINDWVEQTDPTKHVFEDLGIAAFLIELWRDMYGVSAASDSEVVMTRSEKAASVGAHADSKTNGELSPRPDRPETASTFPGFVDIGCGNGVLTHILISEGYKGWGFDARRRKTWETFPATVQDSLKELVLVPSILDPSTDVVDVETYGPERAINHKFHNGVFEPGTFIVSNHADELTPWTPLLGYLNQSPFIAIPCCSHDLAGSRSRAPPTTRALKSSPTTAPSPTSSVPLPSATVGDGAKSKSKPNVAETGSLARKQGGKKVMPSAYSTLVSYVCSLAEECEFVPEREMLRIPSTRNACVVGRRMVDGRSLIGRTGGEKNGEVEDGMGRLDMSDDEGIERARVVTELITRELGLPIDEVRRNWIEKARMIAGKKGDGH
ncbi:hypothetical protein MBLNU457_g0353t1 [Dothideomycetes sp. NU457]